MRMVDMELLWDEELRDAGRLENWDLVCGRKHIIKYVGFRKHRRSKSIPDMEDGDVQGDIRESRRELCRANNLHKDLTSAKFCILQILSKGKYCVILNVNP